LGRADLDRGAPLGRADLDQMMERFPDGR